MNEEELATLKVPPHSREAEQSVLGAVLLDNQAFDRVSWLRANAFYQHGHRVLWEALSQMIERGKTADVVTICEALGGDLEKAGGAAYIGSLAQNTPSAFNVIRYAELVRDKWVAREIITKAWEIAEKGFGQLVDIRELAEEASAAFLAIQFDHHPQEMVEFGRAAVEAVEWIDNPTKGLSSGYEAIDRIVHGLMPGDLIVVAGRPSMGKTALAMNIAEHVAATDTAAVFSLEMTRRKVAARSIRYHESEIGRDRAIDHVSGLKLHIDDSPSISLGHMRLRLRRLKRKTGSLGLVVVDYLQLMQAKAENRTQEVSAISRGLKEIAKEFEVPVIAVAQLSRGVEARTDHRPMLSDLRESGQVEQDADVIAFVYRDEYYNAASEWRGIAEVIVRKNRDGATGTAYLDFVPEYTRFKALSRELPSVTPVARRGKENLFDFKSKAAGE